MKNETVVINEDGEVINPPPELGAMPAGVPVFFKASHHLPLIKKWAREGMTLKDMAERCGVSVQHLAVWRGKFPAVHDAITEGYAAAQAVVENKLYEMALGEHEWTETTVIEGRDAKGFAYREVKRVTKRAQPSVKAQIFILKNVAPDDWKDKMEIKSEREMKIIWNEFRSELTEADRERIKALPAPSGKGVK
jgi:hypothetical protein